MVRRPVADQRARTAAKCQCRVFPGFPCAETATQEDLLCDACRSRCEILVGTRHLHIGEFRITLNGCVFSGGADDA